MQKHRPECPVISPEDKLSRLNVTKSDDSLNNGLGHNKPGAMPVQADHARSPEVNSSMQGSNHPATPHTGGQRSPSHRLARVALGGAGEPRPGSTGREEITVPRREVMRDSAKATGGHSSLISPFWVPALGTGQRVCEAAENTLALPIVWLDQAGGRRGWRHCHGLPGGWSAWAVEAEGFFWAGRAGTFVGAGRKARKNAGIPDSLVRGSRKYRLEVHGLSPRDSMAWADAGRKEKGDNQSVHFHAK